MRPLARLALALLLFSAGAPPLPAQLVRASAVQGWSGHELLGDPRGVDVRFAAGDAGRLRYELGYARLTSRAHGSGVACAGLIFPERCPVEPLERSGRLDVLSFTVPVELLRRGSFSLAVIPEAGIARARGAVRGHVTGNHLQASQHLVALGAGVALRYRPLAAVPLQLHAGAHAQGLASVSMTQVLDGYTPFGGGLGWRRMDVGLSLGWPGTIR